MPQRRPSRSWRAEMGVTRRISNRPASRSRRKLPAALKATPRAKAVVNIGCQPVVRPVNKSPAKTNSATSIARHQPHLVNRAVHEYSCNQLMGLRPRARARFQWNTLCQKSDVAKNATQRGCAWAASSCCQVACKRRKLWFRTQANSPRQTKPRTPTSTSCWVCCTIDVRQYSGGPSTACSTASTRLNTRVKSPAPVAEETKARPRAQSTACAITWVVLPPRVEA